MDDYATASHHSVAKRLLKNKQALFKWIEKNIKKQNRQLDAKWENVSAYKC